MKKQKFYLMGTLLIAIMTVVQVQALPNVSALEVTSKTISSSGTLMYQSYDNFEKAISYFSRYDSWTTDNQTLQRDFSKFKSDGISVVNLAVHWYKIEKNRGEYSDAFLDGVKRSIEIASNTGLKVRVCILASMNAAGLTPDYVIDPVTGGNNALAIIRSDDMRKAYLDMYNYTTSYLSKESIWGWNIFGEPWYFPRTLDPPFNSINQKENFITLFQELSTMVKAKVGSATNIDVNFISTHMFTKMDGTPGYENLFEKDWGWDSRIFQCVDSIRFVFSTYEQMQKWPGYQYVYDNCINITKSNVERCSELGKSVFLTLQADGDEYNDESVQLTAWKQMLSDITGFKLSGATAYAWRSDKYGTGMNLCNDDQGNPRAAYYEFINF
jgi:hypothetical protein